MASDVVQGHFPAGRTRIAPHPAATRQPAAGRTGPPPPAGAPRPSEPGRAAARPDMAHPGALQPRAAAQLQAGRFVVDPTILRKTGPGAPLPGPVRAHMEQALGADFGDVRVHVGPQAERIGAIAFTAGADIFFAPGRFAPETAEGRRLLGHELAHVVQQRQGRVRGTAGSVTVVQDAALEAEADRAGVRAGMAAVAQPFVARPAMEQRASLRLGAGRVGQPSGCPAPGRESQPLAVAQARVAQQGLGSWSRQPLQFRPGQTDCRTFAQPVARGVGVVQRMEEGYESENEDELPQTRDKRDPPVLEPPPASPKKLRSNTKQLYKFKKGAGQSETWHIVPITEKEIKSKRYKNRIYYNPPLIQQLYPEGTLSVRVKRSYVGEGTHQKLRWLCSLLLAQYPDGVEFQAYLNGETLWISSNKNRINAQFKKDYEGQNMLKMFKSLESKDQRTMRHKNKLLGKAEGVVDDAFFTALENGVFSVPPETETEREGLHAERRIMEALGKKSLSMDNLGGVKRPCLVCARALQLVNARPGPLWASGAATHDYDMTKVLDHAVEQGIMTYVTKDREGALLDTHDTDSDSD